MLNISRSMCMHHLYFFWCLKKLSGSFECSKYSSVVCGRYWGNANNWTKIWRRALKTTKLHDISLIRNDNWPSPMWNFLGQMFGLKMLLYLSSLGASVQRTSVTSMRLCIWYGSHQWANIHNLATFVILSQYSTCFSHLHTQFHLINLVWRY